MEKILDYEGTDLVVISTFLLSLDLPLPLPLSQNYISHDMLEFWVFRSNVSWLIKIDGDLITGENTFLENATKYLDILVKPMVSKNVPWASTYGNHDSQFNLSREALFREEARYPLSYTRHSPRGVQGVTNYYLPVYPPLSSE